MPDATVAQVLAVKESDMQLTRKIQSNGPATCRLSIQKVSKEAYAFLMCLASQLGIGLHMLQAERTISRTRWLAS